MELNEIWLGIIIPIIIGPIFIYLKTIRDEYSERNYIKLRERYLEEREQLFTELKNFYWPVYIHLLCIKQYSYSIPLQNKFRYESQTSLVYSSDSNDYVEDKEEQESHSDERVEECQATSLENSEDVASIPIINETNDYQVSIDILSKEIHDKILKPHPLNKANKPNKTKKQKTIILDKDTLNHLESTLNEKYKEVIQIIEEHISLVCIHENLSMELIDFIKYSKLREIIHEGSPKRQYNIEYFGMENNIEKVIIEIKQVLDKLNNNYNNLLRNPI
jgi:hypothetical protein